MAAMAEVFRPKLVMTLPRTVAEVLSEQVVFEVECIDRMYLNVYVPQLQYAAGLVGLRSPAAGAADRLDRAARSDQRGFTTAAQ